MNTARNKKPFNKVKARIKPKEVPIKTPSPVGFNPWLIAVILFITFIAYLPALQNELLKTWDDQAYVTNNSLIKDLSLAGIVKIFKEDRGLYANYHPLTTLSLAVNYSISGISPAWYHLTNLFIHLVNTLLVFLFIFLLPGRKVIAAAIAALLFGIHPMHVESVAWVSERKNVLYTMFFLGSLISYQHFLKQPKDLKFYILSLALFACSLFSKAMAAPLPLVLFLIDYLNKRKWNGKMILEKLPFFLFSIGFGILAMKIQSESNSTSSDLFSLSQRLLHGCYGFTTYIVKIIAPVGLSAIYPYPYPLVNSAWVLNSIPAILYITFFLTMCFWIVMIILIIKRSEKTRILSFGVLFYTFTIFLVLQFIPVGRVIMADRYSYLPSIGIFILIGFVAEHFYAQKKYRFILISVVSVYAGILAVTTFEYIKVWKNDETLWTDVINRYPNDSRIILAVANRANYFYLGKRMPEALHDYLLASSMDQNDAVILEKTGRIYGQEMNNIDSAMYYLQKAYEKNPKNYDVLTDLGTVCGMHGDLRNSLKYSLEALQIDGNDPALLYNIGITYQNLGETEKAKLFFEKSEKVNKTVNEASIKK